MGRFIFGVFAVFNILAGISFIGCGVCANVSEPGSNWKFDINGKVITDEKKLQAHLEQEVPGYPAVKIAGIVLGYALCAGMILSGVALFWGQWWGKLLACPVYVFALLHHLGFMIYYLVWVNPAVAAFFDQIPRVAIPGAGRDVVELAITAQSFWMRFPGYVSIAWWIAGCIYYLIALPAVMFASTSGAAEGPEEECDRNSRDHDEDEEGEDDDYDDDRRRPRRRYSR